MLVFTRKVGEEIIINAALRVAVVAIQRDRVRLGITAPRETVVDRSEVHERRMAQRRAVKPAAQGETSV